MGRLNRETLNLLSHPFHTSVHLLASQRPDPENLVDWYVTAGCRIIVVRPIQDLEFPRA